jgi:crotonobetainyl-CoA:carnitine CoA-transferase CaiB-like acyl-CoA transferase
MDQLLTGIRVLDLSRMLAGPYGTMLLGDLGAEIIKIEDHAGDFTRAGGQGTFQGLGDYFMSINRNKKSVVLDLKQPRGKEIFYDLVKVSDVVYDNMRPKALKGLKADFDDLVKYNPKIISCSLSGYGHTGPYQDLPSFDLIVQAMGGGMSVTGEKGGAPVRMGYPLGDLAGGMFSALAIVSAIVRRDRTGKGQKIDTSLLDGQVSMSTYLTAYLFRRQNWVPGPQGSQHETIVPYEAFKTKDIYIVVACVTPKFWEGLCRALDLPELIKDERFLDGGKRIQNHDALVAILRERFLTKTCDEWLDLLEKEQVPRAPVNTLDRVVRDPQVLARNMVPTLENPKIGKINLAGNPIKTPGLDEVYNFPPRLGEHTAEVLKGLIKLSDEEIQRLAAEKVIGLAKEME